MQGLVDSFWRAAAYCLHPRVIALSLLPLLIAGVLVFGFMYFFWEGAIAGVRATLESWLLIESLLQWLDTMGLQSFRSALSALVVLAGVLPVVVVLSLLLVAVCMTPAIVGLVAQRRFPLLERKRGGTLLHSVAASLGATLIALVLIVLSMPL
ncbi:MAG TPA: EI24 domain-containing protein, partial [Roseateles sp.]|uniref:EI24 domain-containing protein n=1 Tax=Roseateles sp. TaxID=1971397 RepID=UPI002ED798BA